MSGTMTDLIGDNPQDMVANARAMLRDRGAPMTAENLNRAMQMIHGSRTDGTDFIMDQVDAADNGATSIARPRSRTANQPPPTSPRAPMTPEQALPPPPLPIDLTGETTAPAVPATSTAMMVGNRPAQYGPGDEASGSPEGVRTVQPDGIPQEEVDRLTAIDRPIQGAFSPLDLLGGVPAGARGLASLAGRGTASAVRPRIEPQGPAVPPQAAPATGATPSSYVDDIIARSANPTSTISPGGPVAVAGGPGGVPGRSDPLLTGPHFGPRPTGIPQAAQGVGSPPPALPTPQARLPGPQAPREAPPASQAPSVIPQTGNRFRVPAQGRGQTPQDEVQRRVAQLIRSRQKAREPVTRSERRNAASSR